MFDPYNESLASTGEPPTTENRASVQEPDSGYEASPSSIADNQRFFGEQSSTSRQSSNVNENSDDEDYIVEVHSQILFSESESDELDYDTCIDCCNSPASCLCIRTDSSTTNATDSPDQVLNQSSQPIQIPLSSNRIRSNRLIISPINICPFRSQSSDFNPRVRLGLLSDNRLLPFSWPPTSTNSRNSLALNSPSRSNTSNTHTHYCHHPVRSRRQLINSEESSYSSSEDEGPEDVFHMPSGEASSYPTTMMSSVPLPDVVLESTDSGRRSRSMSINLPPDREQMVRDVGQSLRRMSDLFVQSRQLRMAVIRGRSRTASECDEHLHRNGLS